MQAQPKKSNLWAILGIIGLVIIFILAIAVLVNVLFSSRGGSTGGPETSVPTPAPGVPSATANEAVNVRTGPGIAYPSYGIAPKGSVGEVIGVSSNGQWWVVKLPATIAATGQGWVYGLYIQLSNVENVPIIPAPPSPPPVDFPKPPPGAPTATALDAVNIRGGPGSQYPAYGVAPKGAKGEVIGVSQDGQWWVVKLPTIITATAQGWVSAQWVETSNTDNMPVIAPPDQQPPVNLPSPPEGVPTAIALDYINVRSGPGFSYSSYGIAPPGASAEIIGESIDGQWWVIRLPSVSAGRAWVSAAYVQAINVTSVPAIPAP